MPPAEPLFAANALWERVLRRSWALLPPVW